MLSRVAENLYWLGRHLERAENVARMARADHEASLESRRLTTTASAWDGLLSATGAEEAYATAHEADPTLSVADFLILGENENSLRATVARARWLARGLREHITPEAWEEINSLHLDLAERRHFVAIELDEVCDSIRHRIQTVFGLYGNTALRDEGREWLHCGEFIERADMTSRIIDSKYHLLLPEPTEVGGPLDHFQWKAILQSASAWEAYRRVGLREVNGSGVLDLLMFNPSFPRSLKFSVSAMRRHYSDATRETPSARRVSALRQMMLLELDIDTLDVDQVVAHGLHEFIDSFQDRLNQINDAVARDVFTVLPEGESVVSPQAARGTQ